MKNKDPFFKAFLAILPVLVYALDVLETLKFAGATAVFYGLTVLLMNVFFKFQEKSFFEICLIFWTLFCASLSFLFLETSPLVFMSLWILLPFDVRGTQKKKEQPFLKFEKLPLNLAAFQALLFLMLFLYLALMRVLLVEKLELSFFNEPVGFLVLFFLVAWLYQALIASDEQGKAA